jgi:hypothetical protein
VDRSVRPRRRVLRIARLTSASAPARISSSPAPPRPITASADRISPRAAGSLNASFNAATPSGSPSSAFAIPRGTGRRPFRTSRSHPGTRPAGVFSSVPDTRPPAMRATVSGPRLPAVYPVSAMTEPSGGVLGRKLRKDVRGRPRRTTTRAAGPASGGSNATE